MKSCLQFVIAVQLSLLTGCVSVSPETFREFHKSLQGEWQLLEMSNRDMRPGHGERVYYKTTIPRQKVFRNGYYVHIEGTNLVESVPYRITKEDDTFVIHAHSESLCGEDLGGHFGAELEGDSRLVLWGWDPWFNMGIQNSLVAEYQRLEPSQKLIGKRIAVQKER